jgi:hypothetical protein
VNNKALYYTGVALLSVGVTLMCKAAEIEGRQSVIWVEADKSVKVDDGASIGERE